MKTSTRLLAFLLALLMTFALTACEYSSTHPTDTRFTGSLPITSSTAKYDTAEIFALIADLQAATTETVENYTQAMDLITADFEARPEGTDAPAFQQLAADLVQTRDTRLAALSGIIEALENLDLTATATVAAKVAEAENLLSREHHVYGEKILHSRNLEGTLCTDADHYQICTLCNDLKWTKGEHQWFYSRNMDTHQKCCRVCDATEASSAHDTNDRGQCNVCNYKMNANILLIECIDGEAQKLSAMIDKGHTVTTVNIKDSEKMPTTIDGLKSYDEVILVNIANRDMPQGFDQLLQSYVQDFGGGLLTVGGDKAYQLEDMGGTTYEELLPVEMTVPSMAVMIIVDTSGSMWNPGSEEPYEKSKLFAAVQGAEACLDVLCENDYVGVMSLGDYYTETIELTPRPQRDKILAAIADLSQQGPGGTIFSAALERAGQALKAMTNVDKRHIILITDGEPAGPDFEAYTYAMKQNAAQGITMSIVGIQCTKTAAANMKATLSHYAGMNEKYFYDVQELSQVANVMREGMAAPELRDIQCQRYMPSIVTDNSITANLTVENMPALDGAHHSKLKEGATEVLGSPYGPLYAHWNYGKGMVGSFMCDLNGTWSADFISSESGATMIRNMISHLVNEKTAEEEAPSISPTVGNQVGDLCPSAQLHVLTGDGVSERTIDPSALGKITIINFWGAWCRPSKSELPFFDEVASMFPDQVAVIAVHSMLSVSDGPGYITERYPNSKIIFAVDNKCDKTDFLGVNGELFLALGFQDAYPATVILDENGVIIYSSTKCFLTLEELLAVLPESLFDDAVS